MSMTDPTGQSQGGEGGGGGAGEAPDPRDAEIQRLKTENAEAREKNRGLSAKALGAEHRLSPTQVELLGKVDLDQQADYAGKLAAEAAGQVPAPTPAATPTGETAPATPPAQPDPAAADPSLAHMQSGGEGSSSADVVPQGWRAQMEAEINVAGSFDEVQEIQRKYQEIRAKEQAG